MRSAVSWIGNFLLLVTLPAGAVADLADCRDRVAEESSRYASLALRKIDTCHQGQLRGKLPPSLDCSDPSAWSGTAFAGATRSLERQAERMSRAVASRCAEQEPAFTTCPDPCAAAIDTIEDIDGCYRCLAGSCTISVMTSVYGSTMSGAATRSVTRCYRRIGTAARKYFHQRQKLIRKCEANQRAGREGFVGIDCAGLGGEAHPYRATVERYVERLAKSLASCSTRDNVDIGADLSSCGTDVASETACVASVVDTCLAGMIGSVYAPPTPIPTGTSTPTKTPTPTPTKTVTCAPTGTPYCTTSTCLPCEESRPGCYTQACGLCVPYSNPCQPGSVRGQFCVHGPLPSCLQCPCLTTTPTKTPTPTPTPTPTQTPTCAPTGTPYCSTGSCQPCPESRPGCYAQTCGLCVPYSSSCPSGAVRDDFCVHQPYSSCLQCPCLTMTPTRTSTPTPTPSPTRTLVDCGASAPVVEPLPPVTDTLLLEITGSVYVHGPYSAIEACSEAGCTTTNLPTAHPTTHPFTAYVDLQPDTLNHVSICTRNPICGDVACAATQEVLQSSGP